MIRPTLAPGRSSRAIHRNLALDVVAAIGMGVTMALVGAILPTVARRGGLAPIGLSALAAAPFIANLLGAFAGRIGARRTGHLTLIRGIGAASLVLLAVAPPPPIVVGVAIVFWLSISFGGPFHLRLWGAMYPARLRGRVLGVLGMSRAAAGALAAISGGVLADRIGGEQAVAIAGAVGAVCALAYLGIRAARSGDGPPTFSAREAVAALRERPLLSRIAVAQGFYGGGLIAATPLYALVNVDRLNLSLADVGVIGILTAIATTIAFPIWGMVADRFGPVAALRTGSAIGLTALFAYAFAPNVVVLWVAALAAGTGSASIDVGIASAVSDQTPLASRAAAMAGWNALTGARGVMAAFLMSVLLELRIVDVTFALLACAGTSAVGVALFIRARRAWTGAPATSRPPIQVREGSNLRSSGGRSVESPMMSPALDRR
ncbi:MAG TPA: MFS transporter [Candidatus Limnocylindrales bacterium]|nr:MFS transporter [Candidatus Limnocylindrales bacterium]